MTRLLRWSSSIYGNLLRVCPQQLRRDFGTEMILVFSDDLADAWLQGGLRGVFRAWRCAAAELLEIGLSNALASPGFLVPLISCGISTICLGGELALARAHVSPGGDAPNLLEAVLTIVVWPSFMAALVSFTAIRASARGTTLPLICQPNLKGSKCSKCAA